MREILFRGKRTDNGEWVYGSLLSFSCGRKVIMPNAAKVFMQQGTTTICCNESYDVTPATVGLFTGLTGKNGVKIFKGDIVRTKKFGKICGHTNVNDFDCFSVQYEPCMFRLVNKCRGFNLVDDGFSKYEIIGNIHDNPELLEGGDET